MNCTSVHGEQCMDAYDAYFLRMTIIGLVEDSQFGLKTGGCGSGFKSWVS